MNVLDSFNPLYAGGTARLTTAVLDAHGALRHIIRGFLRCPQPAKPGRPAGAPVVDLREGPGPDAQHRLSFKPEADPDRAGGMPRVRLPDRRGPATARRAAPPKEAED